MQQSLVGDSVTVYSLQISFVNKILGSLLISHFGPLYLAELTSNTSMPPNIAASKYT